MSVLFNKLHILVYFLGVGSGIALSFDTSLSFFERNLLFFTSFFSFIFISTYLIKERKKHLKDKMNDAYDQESKLLEIKKENQMVIHDIKKSIHNLENGLNMIRERQNDQIYLNDTIPLCIQEVEHLNHLCSQSFDSTTKIKLRFKVIDIHKLIHQTIHSIKVMLEEKSILILLKLNAKQSQVLASYDDLRQVLLNLLHNAVEAMPKGGEIKVSTSNDDSKVLIAIKDTGGGISPEHRSKIFSTYFSNKQNKKHSGLGLAICNRMIRRLGGTIDFESILGVGTQFQITLPTEKI